MQRISRAEDNIWVTSAFDPKKPYDEDWASKDPAPILRSGPEANILEDSPLPHNSEVDAMRWGGNEEEPEPDRHENSWPSGRPIPDLDLRDIGLHTMNLVSDRLGKLEGSQGHYVEYPNGSSVNHYYTYHPQHDLSDRWSLQSIHPLLQNTSISYHPTFKEAVGQTAADRADLEAQADREYPD